MTAQVLRDVHFWFAQYALRGQANSCALQDAMDIAECTVFGDVAKRRVGTMYNPTVGLEGYYGASAALIEAPVAANMGVANVPVSVAPLGNTVGMRAYLMRAINGSYNFGGAVGELNPFSFEAEGSDGGRLVRGYVGEAATRTASGNAAAVNAGAIASGGRMYAALHVLDASAGDTLDIVLASDSAEGFGSPTSRVVFDQVSAAGYQWKEIDGPVTDTWWRVQSTIGGVGPSFNYVLTFGIIN